MFNIILATILSLFLLSCTKPNIYKQHKIPVENAQYLNGMSKGSIKPYTKPQYGNYNRPINNKQFYNSLFDDKKTVIYDNVANNNIPLVKPKIAPVKIAEPAVRMVKPARPATKKPQDQFYIQVGAYAKVRNVQKTQKKVQKYGNLTFEEIIKGKESYYRKNWSC